MADVRSMLRKERTNRRITHPNASYTTDGKLLCNICETLVKSEAAWGAHLHSTQHTLRLSRVQDAATTRKPADTSANRKRKASSLDSPAVEDDRKRVRAEALSKGSLAEAEAETPSKSRTDPNKNGASVAADASANIPEPEPADDVDDAEYAAFERELAELEARNKATEADTISAAPMTAEELAARARDEASTQRSRRDTELQAEKEDAERLLEDEFDEMEELEERVRKLKERREALREAVENGGEHEENVPGPKDEETKTGHDSGRDLQDDGDDEDDDEDPDDFDDGWQFGST